MKLARTLAQLDNSISYKNVKQPNGYYDILLLSKNVFRNFYEIVIFLPCYYFYIRSKRIFMITSSTFLTSSKLSTIQNT